MGRSNNRIWCSCDGIFALTSIAGSAFSTLFEEVKGLSGKKSDSAWNDWCKKWAKGLAPGDWDVFDCLSKTRDHDTHEGMIVVTGQIAAGLFPIVMFRPGKASLPPRELISCFPHGLDVADRLIQQHASVTVP